MELEITHGLQATDASPSDVNGICQTGNCTYNAYTSLGVCSSVEDVTPRLVKSCPPQEDGTRSGCNYTVLDLRDHPTLQGADFSFSGIGDALWVGSSLVSHDGYRYPKNHTLIEFYVVYTSDPSLLGSDPKANYTAGLVALKGTLDLCLYSYYSTVTSGVTKTTQLDVSTNLKWQSGRMNITRKETPILKTIDADGKSYYITDDAILAFNNYLSSVIFQGSVEASSSSDESISQKAKSDSMQAIYNGITDGGGIQGLSRLLENLATSMTNG